MRISNLYVDNFLGIELADVPVRAPVLLFCGANGSGKSSIRDAIALALTGDLGRVSLKKDAAQLIRDGAHTAICEVTDGDGDARKVILRDGKVDGKRLEVDPILPYVLDAQRFAALSTTERRAFLLGLTGVKTEQGDIARRLEARGCHIGKAHRILSLLRSGFDAAHGEAKSQATEAKTAWRVTTGEPYGSEKAKTWRAPVPAFDAGKQKELQTKLAAADAAIGSWHERIGQINEEAKRRTAMRSAISSLQEGAERRPRIEAKLAIDRGELAAWDAQLRKLEAAAGDAPRVGLVHELAACLSTMMRCIAHEDDEGLFGHAPEVARANAALSAYAAEHGPLDAAPGGDPDARAKLPAALQSRALMASAVANGERDLKQALAAAEELARIETELAQPFDQAALDEAQAQIQIITASRAAATAELDALRTTKAAAESAEAKTKAAGEHAVTVAEWDAIAQALSPDGIPAELLGEALGPVNDRLTQSALDAEWPRVEITVDMEIRTALHERPYRLLSESERWRCDAMIAEAIAHVSGVRLLVLDRMDVLDLPGRGDLFAWLDVLAENGEIDSAVIFATLKAPPTELGERVQVEWIEAGRCTPAAIQKAA